MFKTREVSVYGRHIHMQYFEASGTPILDFLLFLWLLKPEWVVLFALQKLT